MLCFWCLSYLSGLTWSSIAPNFTWRIYQKLWRHHHTTYQWSWSISPSVTTPALYPMGGKWEIISGFSLIEHDGCVAYHWLTKWRMEHTHIVQEPYKVISIKYSCYSNTLKAGVWPALRWWRKLHNLLPQISEKLVSSSDYKHGLNNLIKVTSNV